MIELYLMCLGLFIMIVPGPTIMVYLEIMQDLIFPMAKICSMITIIIVWVIILSEIAEIISDILITSLADRLADQFVESFPTHKRH